MNKDTVIASCYSFSLLMIFIFFFSSCEIINPSEPIPGYIKIDKFNITPTPSLGTDSSKITNVFVYKDAEFQGGYPLPAQFPVIGTGEHTFLFYSGITENGISNTRTTYPFFNPYEQTINLEAGKIVTVNPEIKYYPGTVAAWLESFENVNISLVKGPGTGIGMSKLSAGDTNNYEGISGIVQLNASEDYFQVVTDTSYLLPKDQTPIFLEMNYKCNNPFSLGLIAISSTANTPVPVITINTKPAWNKIYIELASVVKQYPDAYYFKVYIEAYKNSGVGVANFYFDNFKLLHN
jgi:hypothetical protein